MVAVDGGTLGALGGGTSVTRFDGVKMFGYLLHHFNELATFELEVYCWIGFEDAGVRSVDQLDCTVDVAIEDGRPDGLKVSRTTN